MNNQNLFREIWENGEIVILVIKEIVIYMLILDEEYCCNRKLCTFCLKHNYEDGLDKNGLCPFCQGICFCTRCARNDMIVRLKSMYLHLGGDVQLL